MKNNRIAVRGENTLEGIICLAPAIAALRQREPSAEIILIAPENLREASQLVPGIDGFSSDFNAVGAAMSFSLYGPDSGEALGWKIYSEALSSAGNPYHRIDLLRKMISADLVDVNFELLPPQSNDELPASLLSGEEGLRIAICVGSLETSELEAMLQGISALSFPREVFLIGTIKDKKKSSEIVSHWDGQLSIHDLCGRLSLNGWAQVMRTADVCLAAPGSSVLMSSGYGTFTVCFDNSLVRGPIHYPYGHGHLVVQAAEGQDFCSSLGTITGEILSYAVSANSGSVPTLDQWQAFADSRLEQYLGKIRLQATQRIEILLGDGKSLTEMYLRPLIYLGSEVGDVVETFYRLLWEHSLSGRTLTSDEIEILHLDTINSLRTLLTPLEKLFELSRFGGNYSLLVKQALAAGNLDRATEESAKLQEVEELIFSIGVAFPLLSPLTSFHAKCQSHIPDLDAVSLADEMSEVFSDLQSRVLVMLDLAKTLFHTTFQKESAAIQLAESKSSLVGGL